MSHSSSIKELASDIAKLSKTLTTLAEELTSVPTQENAEEAAKPVAKKEAKKQYKEAGEKESSSTSTESTNPVTIEQVRAVMAEKSQAGLTGKVKELLESFGAAKLSAVDPKDYADLLAAAKELS